MLPSTDCLSMNWSHSLAQVQTMQRGPFDRNTRLAPLPDEPAADPATTGLTQGAEPQR